MGPLRVPDETGHMYRAWLVSEGYCTGVPAIGEPVDYRYLPRVPWQQLPRNSTGNDLLKLVDDAQQHPIAVVSAFDAVNLYSCVPYLPAGAAFRLGRFFTGSPLTLMYLGRFGNLIFYLLMVVAAMRILPQFQLPLAVLALMPMSLHQAASLSADVVTNAFSFLMTAYILRLAVADAPRPLKTAEYVLLAACAIMAGLCKADAGLVFLVLLIPANRFPNGRTRWLGIAGCIFLAYGAAAMWQYIDRPNGEIYRTLKAAIDVHFDQNAAIILQQPSIFLRYLGHSFMSENYVGQFVGSLGWTEIALPTWIPWLYLALIGVVAAAHDLLSNRAGRLSGQQRWLLIGIFLYNMASVLVTFWIVDTPRDHWPDSGHYTIAVLGRYMIPFAFLVLLAISGLATWLTSRWLTPAAIAFVVLVNAVALHMVWDHFRAHSSTVPNRLRMALRLHFTKTPETVAFVYDGQLVTNPKDGKVYLVSGGQKHWVMNASWVTAHGYSWPADVNIIPEADLAPIPEGEPAR